jgi:hypothetical protein
VQGQPHSQEPRATQAAHTRTGAAAAAAAHTPAAGAARRHHGTATAAVGQLAAHGSAASRRTPANRGVHEGGRATTLQHRQPHVSASSVLLCGVLLATVPCSTTEPADGQLHRPHAGHAQRIQLDAAAAAGTDCQGTCPAPHNTKGVYVTCTDTSKSREHKSHTPAGGTARTRKILCPQGNDGWNNTVLSPPPAHSQCVPVTGNECVRTYAHTLAA